jgi:hypothetical protein
MEILFKVLAVILLGVAAVFLWQKNWDAVFVAAVLSAVCYFLNMRFQIKARINRRKLEEKETDKDAPE